MFRIDVDAHVDETEATWEYLDDGAHRFKPVTLDPGAARRRATPGRTASGSSTATSDSDAGAMTSEPEPFRRPGSSSTWTPGYATWTNCASTCRCSTRPCSSTRSPIDRRSTWRFANLTIAGSPKPRRRAADGYAGSQYCRCSTSTRRWRNCVGQRTMAPVACSRKASNAATAPPATRTSSRSTTRRAASICPSAFTMRRARSSLRSGKDPAWDGGMNAISAFSALVRA